MKIFTLEKNPIHTIVYYNNYSIVCKRICSIIIVENKIFFTFIIYCSLLKAMLLRLFLLDTFTFIQSKSGLIIYSHIQTFQMCY